MDICASEQEQLYRHVKLCSGFIYMSYIHTCVL